MTRAERLREALLRERGEPFEVAWERALRVACNAGPDVPEWREAFEATKQDWEQAFVGGHTSFGRAVIDP